ncbi:DUF2855 family protein [Brevundimonas sp. Root1279]|uniref:DUF2855 family protein n=1 Tax=Brevundimonas sp. Root1279 TaxID=1736443 RepID=UPI0006FE9D54|nr:DUF2855 family protein [Brevundimonas sp. Root1279]KQW79778.1 hypothetical protein ASC65_14630 [Brevundimonas sp. Root1279]
MSDARRRLMSRKSDPGETRLDALPLPPLAEGEVLLGLDRFSLTTNNITYAAYGDAIGYWRVFPTGEDGWGLMPVWGFADVLESRAPGVEAGARVFGYFPMAGALVVQTDKVSRGGFADASPWRKAVPDIYNRYVLCAADRHYDPALENSEALFRPLFVTSYTAVDFLRDRDFFGAGQIVVSSASSKTAYGAAWCLEQDDKHVLALTGVRNRVFVEGLGCYDAVHGYDEIEALPADVPTLYLDLAGDPDLRRRVHAHFGDNLFYDCLVGSTRSDSFQIDDPSLTGPKPVFFFAATCLDDHRARGTLHAFYERFLSDQKRFFERVVDPASPWITIVEHPGLDAASGVVRALADGASDPAEGVIVRMAR